MELNKVILKGNLTKDPEAKEIKPRIWVCDMRVATTAGIRDGKEVPMYIDVKVWGPDAVKCKRFLGKGDEVLVDGRLKYQTWVGNDGVKREKHFVQASSVQFGDQDQTQSEWGSYG